jgi:hypothetical protein
MRYRGGIADSVLNLHPPGGSAGNVTQIAKERRCPAFALAKMGHQTTGAGGEPRAKLTRRHGFRGRLCSQPGAS